MEHSQRSWNGALIGSVRFCLILAIFACNLRAAAAGNDVNVESVNATTTSKRTGEPKSGHWYAGGWGPKPYKDHEQQYRHTGYKNPEPPFFHDSEHYVHHDNHGRGPRGRKGRKGDPGKDGICAPGRTYTVRSTEIIYDGTAEGSICNTASGSSAGNSCAAAKCAWAGDVLVSGSCTVKAGVGRTSSPICSSKDGDDVKCEGLGPTPSGWACSYVAPERFEAEFDAADVEAVAVCCAATLPTNLVIGFDDLRHEGEVEAHLPQIYKGFEWSSARAINGEEVSDDLEPENCVTGFKTGVKSPPNVLSGVDNHAVSMYALPGFVFTVTSLFATAAWADDVVATFIGYNGSGTELGTVNATINQSGPTQVNLSSLGKISSLKMFASTCGEDAAGSCKTADDACPEDAELFTDLAIDNIAVTVYAEPTARNTWRPPRISEPWLKDNTRGALDSAGTKNRQ